jgi:hypothetical protein
MKVNDVTRIAELVEPVTESPVLTPQVKLFIGQILMAFEVAKCLENGRVPSTKDVLEVYDRFEKFTQPPRLAE